MSNNTIFNLLTKEYSIVLATKEKHFTEVKHIRNDVFNHRYAIYPELKKSNWYLFSKDDEQSFIYLLKHNETGSYVGTVRVFFINKKSPIKTLPMIKTMQKENTFSSSLYFNSCEVSRFSLCHKLHPYKELSELKLRTYLTLGLMVATRINLFLNQYSNTFAIMEPSLHRILTRQKVNFNPIGDTVEYYGLRIPCHIVTNRLLEETEATMGELTRYYLKKLCANPTDFWHFIDQHPYLSRSDIALDKICTLFEKFGDDVALDLLLDKEKQIPLSHENIS